MRAKAGRGAADSSSEGFFAEGWQAMRSNRRDKNDEPEKRPLSLWECMEILQDIGMSDDVIVDCICRYNVCLTRPGKPPD
jgi:hypothetical protein